MKRRSFLSLLISAPLLPHVGRLELPEDSVPPALIRSSTDLIGPGEVGRFVAWPQLPFRPERLLIGGAAHAFEILGVSAAGEPVVEGAVPAQYFAATALATQFVFRCTAPGESIVLAARNHSRTARRFCAALVGTGTTPDVARRFVLPLTFDSEKGMNR
jgi:hypothetical protein